MTAPLVNFSGLASGFDYRALVDAIIAQERQPAVRLENQVATYDAQQTALGGYRTRLAALKTAATALRTGTAFDATTATVSILSGSKALVSASTSASTQPGSHTVKVSQLARAARLAGVGQADASIALGVVGTFAIDGIEIEVSALDSLATIRDRINALNSGSDPLGVSASILSVSTTEHRLVLSASETGAAGIALADVSGTVLQQLGFVDGNGDIESSAVLVAGSDAVFSIDGVAMTRTSNVVADALEGVTLTLTAAEADAETLVVVGRYADAARNALQGFVEAFNGLIDFIKAQGVATDDSRPALYNDPLLRGIRRDLPTTLLGEVFGTEPDLATAASAGLSLTRDGKLTFDAAKFDAAFSTRLPELRLLFGETTTSSSTELSFITSGRATGSGSWDVEITALATRATIATSGFSGSYDAGATADTMTVTDTRSGKSVTIDLATGMSTSDIITALSDAFEAQGIAIEVEADGDDIRLTHGSTGSASGIELSFTGLGDGGSEAWATGTSATGTDVEGTIGGLAAVGTGDLLVGASGTDVAGITVRHTGSSLGVLGSVSLTVGTGAAIERLLDRQLEVGGLLDTRTNELASRTSRANDRIADIDTRLELRRANLLSRFLQMEAAIARMQQVSSNFLAALSPQNGSNR